MRDAKRRVALSSVLAAVLLTGAKLAAGLLIGSLGLLSEAAHSGLDLLAAAMTWWAVSVSDRPADSDHPYGHQKIENLSALFETALLLATCAWIIYEAIGRLFVKTPHVEVNVWSYVVVVGAILVDYSRSRALRRVAKETRSPALEADALHFSSDIYSSLVVLGGLVTTQLGHPKADAVAALGVCAFVAWISVRLGTRAIHALTDRVPFDHVARAEGAALAVPGVRRVYDVRVRQAGAKHFVDLKVAVDRAASIEAAHAVTEEVEKALRERFTDADVLVHAEPDSSQPLGLAEEVLRLADKAGGRVHHLRVNPAEGGLDVELHFEWPCATTLTDAHRLVTKVEESLRRAFPEVAHIQSHLECAMDEVPSRRDVTQEHPEAVADIVRCVRRGEVIACRDVRILEADDLWWISFTCVLPSRLSLHEAHDAATRAEASVRALWDDVGGVSVHTEPEGA